MAGRRDVHDYSFSLHKPFLGWPDANLLSSFSLSVVPGGDDESLCNKLPILLLCVYLSVAVA